MCQILVKIGRGKGGLIVFLRTSGRERTSDPLRMSGRKIVLGENCRASGTQVSVYAHRNSSASFGSVGAELWWAGIAQSVKRLATGWTVRGSNPGGGEIFHTRPDRPWGPPSLLYNGYRVFPLG